MTRLNSFTRSDPEHGQESQDSQAILDALKAQLGVGARGEGWDIWKKQDASAQEAASRVPSWRQQINFENDDVATFWRDDWKKKKKTMMGGSQTQTQVNEDRDYGVFCSSPEMEDTLQADETGAVNLEDTLQEDETAAVDFGDLSPGARQSSQVSEDAGFDNTRGEWRVPGCTPYKGKSPPPETPSLSKNPFGATESKSIPFAGSQLFGQTQLPTSAAKVSPTSSRPSPHVAYELISPPHGLETSPLKDRTNVSSPTNLQTPSPRPKTSPRSRQPLTHYEPMRRSQERKTIDEMIHTSKSTTFEDSDNDDDYSALIAMERRKRVEKKKAQAAKEMERVSFVRPCRRETQQTGHKRPRVDSLGSNVIDAARESQGAPMPSLETAESTKATPGEDEMPTASRGKNDDERNTNQQSGEMVDEEMVPATSPMRSLSAGVRHGVISASELELPPMIEVGLNDELEETLPIPTSDMPLIRRSTRSRARRNASRRSSVASEQPGRRSTTNDLGSKVLNAGSKQDKPHLSPPPDLRNDYTAPLRPNSALQQRDASPKPPALQLADSAMQGSSSLSTLMPTPSSKTASSEQSRSPVSDGQMSMSLPSPVVAKMGRQQRASRKRAGRAATTASLRGAQGQVSSTDELQRSPTSSVAESFMAGSKSSIGSGHLTRGRKLFEDMVFAISMQCERETKQKRSTLEHKITQAGGLVLKDGFQELFEPSSMMIKTSSAGSGEDNGVRLAQSSLNYGFTALIADGHSRKPKYMQALALGLPCLAHQWIAACIRKGEVVDWEPYLLAAGSSAALGDAVRSRCLQPYPAVGASLADVIDKRPRLLADQNMLVVVDAKRARSKVKKEYMFLAQALGARRVLRVSTPKEAREALIRMAPGGFDWIYVDDGFSAIESVLSTEGRPAKRRKETEEGLGAPLARVLKDELVIQSLILGKMIGEDEVDF